MDTQTGGDGIGNTNSVGRGNGGSGGSGGVDGVNARLGVVSDTLSTSLLSTVQQPAPFTFAGTGTGTGRVSSKVPVVDDLQVRRARTHPDT